MAATPDGFFDSEVQSSAVTADPPEDFRVLLRGVREGSEDAAREFIEICAPDIVSAVGRKLWSSFFTSRIDVLRFNQPDELIISEKVGMEQALEYH